MKTLTATNARSKLYQLMDETNKSGEPIRVTGKRGNVILISEDDWRAIDETLYLLSIPGMRESIIEGMNTAVEDCETEPDW